MFLKVLPLDYNNHNYLYSMVMTKKKIANTAREMITETITTDVNVENITKTEGKWAGFMALFMLISFIILTIYTLLHCYCVPSNTLGETTPLLQENMEKKPEK